MHDLFLHPQTRPPGPVLQSKEKLDASILATDPKIQFTGPLDSLQPTTQSACFLQISGDFSAKANSPNNVATNRNRYTFFTSTCDRFSRLVSINQDSFAISLCREILHRRLDTNCNSQIQIFERGEI